MRRIYLYVGMSRLGINGFDRPGRLLLRVAISKGAQVIAINDPNNNSIEYLVYLFKYDSIYGRFKGNVQSQIDDDQHIYINGAKIRITHKIKPSEIDWKGATYIIDTITKDPLEFNGHFDKNTSVRKVLLTTVINGIPLFVMGVNHENYDPKTQDVVCIAESITHSMATILRVIHEHFGIVNALITSVVSLSLIEQNDHNPLYNIIPRPKIMNDAMNSLKKVLPELNGKINGTSYGVPTNNTSLIDCLIQLSRESTYDNICSKIRFASEGYLKDYLGYISESVVSSDFLGDNHSCIIDLHVQMNPNSIRLLGWFDQDIGYSSRIIDFIKFMQSKDY